MYRSVTVECPAKVNLYLEVGSKREDGYHEIRSIFHMVDLNDTIRICSLKKSDFCSVSGDFNFPQEENIVYKSLLAFCEKARIQSCGFDVHVVKRIPSAAGLGGGSSDCAGTLLGLNMLFEGILSDADLFELGASLGSDVPFFLGSPAAMVTGRGEVLRPLPPKQGYCCIIVKPDMDISTAEAYSWLDESRESDETFGTVNLHSLYENIFMGTRPFMNSFEKPVFARYPILRDIKVSMIEAGALYAGLSGSGSAVFGVYKDRGSADSAAKFLSETGQTGIVKMLARLHDAILQ